MRFAALVSLAIALAALSLEPEPARAARPHPSDLWLHVEVQERDAEAEVLITLPLGLVEGVLPLLDGDHLSRGRIRVSEVDGQDLREALKAARSSPEGKFVDIPTCGDGRLEVARMDGQLVFRARDEDDVARVRIPLAVADRLLGTSDRQSGEVDLAGMVRALREFGPGELVTAEDSASSVRIWIDRDHGGDD
jgi:hypothetical protein